MSRIPRADQGATRARDPARVRKRLNVGPDRICEDIVCAPPLCRLSQSQFARAMEISVHTLRNWEQGAAPEGPAIGLLRNRGPPSAHHPRKSQGSANKSAA